MWINLPPGLCNGQYWIVVHLDPHNYFLESNENNNTIAVPITLTQQSGVAAVITASGTTTFCQGGSVTLTASVASNYLWSNGSIGSVANTLTVGNYTVTVTDGNGCSAQHSFTINEPSLLSADLISSTNATCNGASDCCITVNGNDGTPGYSFLW